jgi:alpha-1,2-glucosyltransferase
VLHISQIFYLSLILSLYLPLDTSSFSKSLKSVSSLLGIFLVCICGYCIKYYSYEHPFLLSDNTHYTFYLWRYLKTVNIYLSPIYSISLFYLYHRLSTKPLIFLTWLLCSILVLVPAQLIEPRYFIMPMIFYILHDSKRPSKLRIAALAVLNIGTVVMFAWRPYKGIAFMW